MGFRYQKRINIGDGFGFNLSKSGISTSYRSKYGSIGTRGFSIRTGIPGLTYRGGFSKSKKNDTFINLFIIVFTGAFIVAALIAWNIILFLVWAAKETYHYVIRLYNKLKLKKDLIRYSGKSGVIFSQLSKEVVPEQLQKERSMLFDLLVENNSFVEANSNLAIITIGDQAAMLRTDSAGIITFYKFPGEQLKIGDYICRVTERQDFV